MSVGRLAVTQRAPGAVKTPQAQPVSRPAGAGLQPAIAGRERLGSLLHQSVLIQLMVAMALVALAALIYLNQASKESVLQFSIADLQRQQIGLNLKNANLYATATRLQSLQRIETVATGQLQMSKPQYADIVWLKVAVPLVAAPVPNTRDMAARQQSQPLNWMQNTISFVWSQL